MRRLAMLFSLCGLAAVTLGLLAATGQSPDDAERKKKIAEIEKQITELQTQLKGLKEPAPTQKASLAPASNAFPASWDAWFSWRSIGPANMGGRVTSIAVVESDPSTYYIATATGGLLKTVNNGSTFEHLFEHEATNSIGAVAVSQSHPSIVWVGTGEANPRNSVTYGDGVYKSTDGGKKWTNVGLKKTYQIGKIAIHPKNPDVVYVAALGRLYGPNEERGLYKTTDGGKSWTKILQTDEKTGVLEIAVHPQNPDTMIVATWERQRDEFDSFRGDAKAPVATDVYAPSKVHAPGTALYKTTDGGKTWKKLANGLPKAHLGRIGLDWSLKNPNLVFAVIDSVEAGKGLPPSKAFLGVSFDPKVANALKVTQVVANGPAQKAGVAANDTLVSIDGKAVKTSDDVKAALRGKQPDQKVKVVVDRPSGKDVEKKTLEVTLGTQPPQGGGGPGGGQRGSIGLQIDEAEGGLLVSETAEGGAAEKAGLKSGDLITSADGVKVEAQRDLFKLLFNKKIGDKVTLSIKRGKDAKDVTLTLEPPTTGTPGRPYSGRLGGQVANAQDDQGPEGPNTGGIYRSSDGGESWTRVNSLNERPFYFSVVRADPNDEKTVYFLGIDLYRSTDGGKTFSSKDINKGVHSDGHDLWINPKNSKHLVLGTDGGMYVTYDRAANWEHLNHLALGQFYHVAVDNRRPYHVYGGLQDNGSWGGPSNTLRISGPTNSDYRYVSGGDGFVCQVDPLDPDVIYTESQDGNMARRNLKTGEGRVIRPRVSPGAGRYRFNWNTPFILSHHNPRIFYAGGNYVFRSLQQGENLRMFSPEITRTKRGSATALSESPINPDVLWVGSDDGAVWMTRDGGKTWTNHTEKFKAAGLPGPRWVASIEASRKTAGRCYVVFDAHRSDDDQPYVFVTEDYGATWKSLRGNLPGGPSRVLREDRTNSDLLYLGTEFGIYASLDRGGSWRKINGKSLPTVAIHEIAQPTTANDIVVATHGRSIWVLDVTTLRQTKDDMLASPSTLFAPATATRWRVDATREGMFRTGTRQFVGSNPSGAADIDFLLEKKADVMTLVIADAAGKTVRELDVSKEKEAGAHRIRWDLNAGLLPKGDAKKGAGFAGKFGGGKFGGGGKAGGKQGGGRAFGGAGGLAGPVPPGTYRVTLEVDGKTLTRSIVVENDPRLGGASIGVDEAEEDRQLRKMFGSP